MNALTTYANPYWDAVRDAVHEEPEGYWDPGPKVGGIGRVEEFGRRHDFTSRYSWSITDPATVAFVVEHLSARAVDPLAGNGYWAWLLGQQGIDVAASDLHPADGTGNQWHREGSVYVPVVQADAVDAVTVHGADRTLLLSWPPYDDPIGYRVLDAYSGSRVVFIGEGTGGCCGDDAMWSLLETEWSGVADHKPVQWYGMHDWVTVYERKSGGAS